MEDGVDLEFLRCPECTDGVLVAVVPIGSDQQNLTLDQVSMACLECHSRFAMQVDLPRQLSSGSLRMTTQQLPAESQDEMGPTGWTPGVIEGGRV